MINCLICKNVAESNKKCYCEAHDYKEIPREIIMVQNTIPDWCDGNYKEKEIALEQ